MQYKKILLLGVLLFSICLTIGCTFKEKTYDNTKINNIEQKDENEKKQTNKQYTKEDVWNEFCTSDRIRDNCRELTGKDFYLENIEHLSGNITQLTNHDRYIIEIMSVDCYHCNNSMPYVLEYDNSNKEIPIYTCNFSDDPVTIKEWMSEKDYSFDIGMVEYDLVKYDLGIKYTPCFLFIEKNEIKLAFIGEIKSVEFIDTLICTAYQEQ